MLGGLSGWVVGSLYELVVESVPIPCITFTELRVQSLEVGSCQFTKLISGDPCIRARSLHCLLWNSIKPPRPFPSLINLVCMQILLLLTSNMLAVCGEWIVCMYIGG